MTISRHTRRKAGRGRATATSLAGSERGSVIVVSVVFVMLFLVLGLALYWLVASQTRSTEMERTDVKSFNVAEAGIDAGMLSLKLAWPSQSGHVATVNTEALKQTMQRNNAGLWDPRRSSAAEFIQVSLYDNVDAAGHLTDIPYPQAPRWDSNGDGRMFVDASANVDDNRHRILILAERQDWELTFPANLALFANQVTSGGQGLTVTVEDPNPAPTIPYAFYDVNDAQRKGVREGYAVAPAASSTTFDNVINEALQRALEGIARSQNTYFESASAANAFLTSGQANGKVVYVRSNSAVEISGRTQIGTVEEPTVIVLDTPDGSVNGWDMRGTADFYGIVVNMGNTVLRGTSGIHGAVYVSGTLENKGTGSSGEINYNRTVIANINRQYVISVNIVPNTWQEYTVPRQATTTTVLVGN